MRKDEVTVKLGADISKQEKMENGINIVLIRSLEKKWSFTALSLRSWHEEGLYVDYHLRFVPFLGRDRVLHVRALGWRWQEGTPAASREILCRVTTA